MFEIQMNKERKLVQTMSMALTIRHITQISLSFLTVVAWVVFAVLTVQQHSFPERQVLRRQPAVLENEVEANYLVKLYSYFRGSYTHVWPEMKLGWRMIVGTLIAFTGAAFGSAGGIGAGGIFVPMLSLVVGFDAKSSTAMSKCMIMGLTTATIYYNVQQRHPTLDLPLIDYDLALLVQPMLLLGISIGVSLNIIFANWMVTILLIIAFLGTSTRSFCKGVDMWKKETIKEKEAAQLKNASGPSRDEIAYKLLPGGPTEAPKVSVVDNVYWKQLAILVSVWLTFIVIQIAKDFTATCSVAYWALNLLQIPVAVGATWYQAARLYNRRTNATLNSLDEDGAKYRSTFHLVLCASVSLLAGTLGGLLGLGGGFVLGPMFLEIGIIPQVSSATATFVMAFSSSMCAIEYYLLKRFPVPYALYFVVWAILASLTGQYVVRRWINRVGRASLIVFILSSIIFASAILLGGEGIANTIYQINHNEYMGFEDLCTYQA